jgi:formate/nitrite transporter FocA (FNT family)
MEQRLLSSMDSIHLSKRQMGINFNDKILIANPTTHFLGRIVFGAGMIVIILGVITLYTDDFLMVPSGWVAIGIPTSVVGIILMASALRRN